jgi:hypothetical protein
LLTSTYNPGKGKQLKSRATMANMLSRKKILLMGVQIWAQIQKKVMVK